MVNLETCHHVTFKYHGKFSPGYISKSPETVYSKQMEIEKGNKSTLSTAEQPPLYRI